MWEGEEGGKIENFPSKQSVLPNFQIPPRGESSSAMQIPGDPEMEKHRKSLNVKPNEEKNRNGRTSFPVPVSGFRRRVWKHNGKEKQQQR